MNASILLSLFEVALVGGALWSLCHSQLRLRAMDVVLLMAGAAISIVACASAGALYGVSTTVKLGSFLLMVRLAVDRPFIASRLLIGVTLVWLVVRAFEGEILTKYSAWPFLLWCGCLLYNRHTSSAFALKAIAGAVVLEVLQSLYMGGRGLLITSFLVIAFSALHHGWYRRAWLLFARAAPVLYPVLLLFTLLSFARGDDFFDPTASNIERSALAFWCISLMPDYIFNGPGPDVFFENVNSALATAGRARDDDGIDPHSFLLSYWVGLGVLVMTFAYVMWWRLWSNFAEKGALNRYHERAVASIFAANAIMTFTLQAPDTFARMSCALCVGLALRSFEVAASAHRTM